MELLGDAAGQASCRLFPVLLSGNDLGRLDDVALLHVCQQVLVVYGVAELRVPPVEEVLAWKRICQKESRQKEGRRRFDASDSATRSRANEGTKQDFAAS